MPVLAATAMKLQRWAASLVAIMTPVLDLPMEIPVAIRMPGGAAKRMVEAAEREWGAGAVQEAAPGVTRVLFWLGGKRQYSGQSTVRPVGGFWVRWDHPSSAQATIERIGWDLTAGGSEPEVRQIVDLLAGWPVATKSPTPRSGAA